MSKQNLKINISGMTCVNCSNAIQKTTQKIDGVLHANVSFASSNASFVFDDKKTSKEQIISKINKLGFKCAKDLDELAKQRYLHLKSLKRRFFVSLMLGILLMTIANFAIFPEKINIYFMFFIASIVQFYCAKDFYIHAYSSLKNRNYDMNVLVSLGTLAAYFYSSLLVFFGFLFPEHLRHMYFDGSVMIITFILLGKLLEEKTKFKATNFVQKLIDLSPKYALKECENENIQILSTQLKIGDIVIVKSGQSISADGVIVDSGGEVDTSMITGESMPRYKKVGDEVVAGTILINGYIKLRVTKTSHENTLANIIDLIEDAQNRKMPIARFADKVANIFVPSVIAISIVSMIIWLLCGSDFLRAFLIMISVLIISCPCALGLATPIAIVGAVGLGAKHGIFIKNPEVLEIIKDIKFAVFDKTGTLTKASIKIDETCSLDEEQMLLIKAIEEKSEHPISKALIKCTSQKTDHLKVEDLQILPSKGIKADINGKNIIIGNEKFLLDEGVKIEEHVQIFAKNAFQKAKGVVFVSIDKQNVGAFSLSDEIKEDAKECIQEIKKMGITPIMLTGDHSLNAKIVADNLGIDQIYANSSPEEKYKIIQQIQEKGKVLFVGDGINDCICLKQANIGIAMNSGSDIAKDAGDIILMNNSPKAVVKSIKLSKITMRNIKQNLFWAFFYNIIGIPLAAGLFYPIYHILLTPKIAGIAMSFSSTSVVLNSLRLRLIKL